MSTLFDTLRACLEADEPVALATVVAVSGPPNPGAVADLPPLGAKLLVRPGFDPVGSLGNPSLNTTVARDLLEALDSGRTVQRHYGAAGQTEDDAVTIFLESFTPAAHMVIFGAVDFTKALVRVAKVLGYRVTVCDARPVFATTIRFPDADEVAVEWPDRYLAREGSRLGPMDAVCVLTHDAKFDVPALMGALATGVGYIGAMGSRRTKEDRATRLREAGATEADLARVMAPIGLDIGARTPEETAVAICAEIIALRGGGGTIESLRDSAGPIHRQRPGEPVPIRAGC